MRHRTHRLYAWVTAEEHDEVTALAGRARLTASELIRRLVTGRQLPDTGKHQQVLDLLAVNADLARLGNLLRMALTDEDDSILPQGFDLQELYEDIRRTQGILKDRIRELRQ